MSIDTSTDSQLTTSVDEIRTFLGDMKEKSPEEVLGLPVTSELPKLTVVAAVGTALLLMVATGVMFLVHQIKGPPVVATPAVTATDEDPQPTRSDSADPAPSTPRASDTADTATGEADPDAAIQAMGIGEAKEADRDTNPLESGIDDLLKGIE